MNLTIAYIEGLIWNFDYYYKGIVSSFSQAVYLGNGKPFKAFEQLMAVLPPFSIEGIPEAYRTLMTDPNSELIDFYPDNFRVDTVGKRYEWMGEVILPFIDEDRLKNAMRPLDDDLTEDEKRRNTLGKVVLYSNSGNQSLKPNSQVNPIEHEISGFISSKKSVKLSLTMNQLFEFQNNEIQCQVYEFENPPYQEHIPKLLPNVKLPPPLISQVDLDQVDMKFFAGTRTLRTVANALGISLEGTDRTRRSYDLYSRREQAFTESYNNNRRVNQEPDLYAGRNNRDYKRKPDQYDFGNGNHENKRVKLN